MCLVIQLTQLIGDASRLFNGIFLNKKMNSQSSMCLGRDHITLTIHLTDHNYFLVITDIINTFICLLAHHLCRFPLMAYCHHPFL